MNQGQTVEKLVNPSVQTISFSGSTANIAEYTGDVAFIQQVGAAGGNLLGKIQHSDDGQAWVNVESGGTFATVTSAGTDIQALSLNSRQLKKFVRYNAPTVNGSTAISVSMAGQKQVT